MPTYHLHFKSKTTGSEIYADINVPKHIRGVNHVADYITMELAKKYVKSLKPEDREAAKMNYYDSHYYLIRDELYDLREKLRPA